MKKNILAAAIILVGLLAVLSACQTQTAGDGGSSECTKQEEYTVKVPYNDTEFYYVREGVGRPTCKEEPYTNFDLNVDSLGKRCVITVTNNGNITGEWIIKAKFITTNAGGGPESDPLTKEIAPGETKKFEYTYEQSDTPMSCTNVNVKVPSVEKCKYTFYQNVTKKRTVTKYREETRYRTVPCDE